MGKFFGETPSGILLVTCRFLVIFLVVSRKKPIFAEKVERLIENKMEQTVFNPAQKKILQIALWCSESHGIGRKEHRI